MCFFWVFNVWVLFDIYVAVDKFFCVWVCAELSQERLIILMFLWNSYWIICRKIKNFDRKFCSVFGSENFLQYRWKNLRWKKFLVWWKILKIFWCEKFCKKLEKFLVWWKNFKNWKNFGFFWWCEKIGKLGGFLWVKIRKNFEVFVMVLLVCWGGVGGVTDFCIFCVFWSFWVFGGVWYICVKV